jgi:L-rhamnose 1-dehydrogenase
MSPNQLTDRVAIVTGGSLGIGRAIVTSLAQRGAKVVVNYYPDTEVHQKAIKSIADEIGSDNLLSFAGDISDPETAVKLVAFTVENWGKVDILVNNAGIYPRYDFFSTTYEQYRQTMSVNMDGVFFMTQEAAKQMQKQGNGSIISTSSMTALAGAGELVAYGASKAGVLSIMNSCAVTLGPKGIRCNTILPGTFQTEGNNQHLAKKEYADKMIAGIPLGRFGQPSDIGGAVAFLASDEAAYITGAQLVIDGGTLVDQQ